MRSLFSLALVALVLAPGPAFGQHHDPAHHQSPYADQEGSGIAALSRSELDDLLAGAGMGLARAAELNRYPGPKHVLELAAGLALDEAQHRAVTAIRAGVVEAARRLGREIVERERHLDRRFARGHIDEATLREATAEIATLRGELRYVHLAAHLETRAVLTPPQVKRYEELRGYSSRQ